MSQSAENDAPPCAGCSGDCGWNPRDPEDPCGDRPDRADWLDTPDIATAGGCVIPPAVTNQGGAQ